MSLSFSDHKEIPRSRTVLVGFKRINEAMTRTTFAGSQWRRGTDRCCVRLLVPEAVHGVVSEASCQFA